jgi:HK97 family phage portal protein
MSITPSDAEFIDSRKFQRTEIAGVFRVPAHLVNDLEKATFSNIEHSTLDFIIHSLRPWLVRWEQAINRDLLLPSEQGEYFAEFLLESILRGDTKTRYDAYGSAIQNKWMNANEVRIKENLNPVEGGDVFENPAIQVKPDGTATTKLAA